MTVLTENTTRASDPIQIGDRVPDATLRESLEFGEACPVSPTLVSVAEAAAGKRIALFCVPGAFTGTCSAKHLPGYLLRLDALRARGVDEVWCVSVNDGYTMAAWGRDRDALGKIRMLGDGNGEFALKAGLQVDSSRSGMGLRLRRCSMLLEDGIVTRLNIEQPGKFEVSDADTLLSQLE